MTQSNTNPDSGEDNQIGADEGPLPFVLGGGVLGAILGLPASYYLQSEMVRAKVGIFDYTVGIFSESQAFSEAGLYGNVGMGAVLFGLIGVGVGFAMFKKNAA